MKEFIDMCEKKVPYKKNLLNAMVFGGSKSLLSQIPCIGAVIVGVWDSYCESRTQDFINELSHALSKLEDNKVDKDYIQSEEFCDLFRRALQIRILHRSKEKAKFILGLITESIRNDRDRDFTTSRKESFLIILDQLSDEEMRLLYDFSQDKYSFMTKTNFYEKAKGVEVDGLIAKGILAVDESWEQLVKGTALGESFINYMRVLAKESLQL